MRTFKDGKLSISKEGDWPEENSIGLPMSNPAIPSSHDLKDAKRILSKISSSKAFYFTYELN